MVFRRLSEALLDSRCRDAMLSNRANRYFKPSADFNRE